MFLAQLVKVCERLLEYVTSVLGKSTMIYADK